MAASRPSSWSALDQRHAEHSVLVIGQPSLPSASGKLDDTVRRIVDPMLWRTA